VRAYGMNTNLQLLLHVKLNVLQFVIETKKDNLLPLEIFMGAQGFTQARIVYQSVPELELSCRCAIGLAGVEVRA
jgi:hypothetical protein